LCEKAHELEMRVILDAVFNHTGNDSLYFNQYGTYDSIGAYQSEKSKYASFYFEPYWKDGVKKYPSWWDFSNLPRCNGNSPQWRSYIFGEGGIIDKWFSLGIDGIRLDVADELQDDFIEGIRIAVKRNKPDGFIIGEVWKNPMRMNRGYLESGKGMDSVMNYLLVDSLIRYFKYADVSKLESIIQEILIEYPADTIFALMNFTSTHDISRAIEIFACDDFQQYGEWSWNLLNDSLPWIRNHKLSTSQYKRGREIYKAYVFTLVFLPGILSIFYGDEVGLQGIGNLANRAPYPWNKRDKKLLKFFRDMGKVRKKEKFLETAELKVISIDGQKLIFERYDGQSRIIVVVNRTDTYVKCEIPKKYKAYDIVYSLNNSTDHELTPYGGIAVKVK
jgi:glycosidase